MPGKEISSLPAGAAGGGGGKPSVGGRLRYLVGGSLPKHREWVRHDLLDPGWRLRVLGRVSLQLLPFVIIALVVPGIDGVARALLEALLVISALMTAATAAEQIRNRRLRQHGFPIPDDPDEQYRQARRY